MATTGSNLAAEAKLTDSDRPLTEEQIRAAHVEEVKPLSGRILLVDYDPRWADLFEREAARIRAVLATEALRIEHVGSTSVPGLPAKPIVDVLLVVTDSADEGRTFRHWHRPAIDFTSESLTGTSTGCFKGPDTDINLHTFSAGCPEIDRMLLFRDWLRANPADRQLYAETKSALAQKEWRFVQNYADAKSAVIDDIMSRARQFVP